MSRMSYHLTGTCLVYAGICNVLFSIRFYGLLEASPAAVKCFNINLFQEYVDIFWIIQNTHVCQYACIKSFRIANFPAYTGMSIGMCLNSPNW